MIITISVPIEVQMPTTGSYTCTNVQNMATSSFPCAYDATARTIIIPNQQTGVSSPGSISFKLNNLSTPTSNLVTSSFIIATSHTSGANTYQIDQLPSGITIPFECDPNCLTCEIMATKCLSCSSTSSFRYYLENQCLNTCPIGFFESGTSCLACDSTCLECDGSASTCTKCSEFRIFHETSCLSSCPTGYVEKDEK